MTLLWVLSGTALAAAIAAWIRLRRVSARQAQLSEMYWELKYQHLELRKQVERSGGAVAPSAPAPVVTPPKESFVPLTSLRR